MKGCLIVEKKMPLTRYYSIFKKHKHSLELFYGIMIVNFFLRYSITVGKKDSI